MVFFHSVISIKCHLLTVFSLSLCLSSSEKKKVLSFIHFNGTFKMSYIKEEIVKAHIYFCLERRRQERKENIGKYIYILSKWNPLTGSIYGVTHLRKQKSKFVKSFESCLSNDKMQWQAHIYIFEWFWYRQLHLFTLFLLFLIQKEKEETSSE